MDERARSEATRRKALLAAGLVMLCLAGAWVSSARSGTDPEVTIKLFQFTPATVDVKTGTRVTWSNTDAITHTVTSGTPDNRDGRFSAPLAGKGATYGFTFTKSGTYSYFCERHPHMRGEIRVD